MIRCIYCGEYDDVELNGGETEYICEDCKRMNDGLYCGETKT
jgi:hypothetical protein